MDEKCEIVKLARNVLSFFGSFLNGYSHRDVEEDWQ